MGVQLAVARARDPSAVAVVRLVQDLRLERAEHLMRTTGLPLAAVAWGTRAPAHCGPCCAAGGRAGQ
ncbi:hypothetical protein ACFWBC_16220 [Streptomyces sp. NPDC059985]|uniref:hypothetical protein n=1 Tax=Streptomyces sp. NPDC059985 TaxID=3347025 RepID=UPI0036A6E74F